ncbi:MAG: hypothetical protein IPM92_16125 [Saprospiraceae bacterium]|nr:hypothetical protein [Saprospiraceae bacterium]
MEISIHIKFLRDLTFQDELLLQELLDEWVDDANLKMIEIQKRIGEADAKRIFNSLHELKTNFTMLRCGLAIRTSDILLHKLEQGELISFEDLNPLDEMLKAIILLIQHK